MMMMDWRDRPTAKDLLEDECFKEDREAGLVERLESGAI